MPVFKNYRQQSTFEMIESSQSDYAYPKYPQSYQDFIPKFTLTGTQTTVMLADLWSVLDALVEENSLKAKGAFENIMQSLPMNKLIPVRITDKAQSQERMLINPWYIFINLEEGITLRPFFEKTMNSYVTKGDFSYLQSINTALNRLLTTSIPTLNLSIKEQKHYPVIHDYSFSLEQFLTVIDAILNQKYFIKINYESAYLIKEKIAKIENKKERQQAEILRLETDIPKLTDTIKELKKTVAKQVMLQEVEKNKAATENERIHSAIENKKNKIKELEDKIVAAQSDRDRMEKEDLNMQKRLLQVNADVQLLTQNEDAQRYESDDTKRNYEKAARMVSWLTQKVDLFRREIITQLNAQINETKLEG